MKIKSIIFMLMAFLACQTMAAQSSLSMPGKQKPNTGQTVNSPKQKQKQKQSTASSTTPKQKPLTGTINGHEWVDLGLPSGLKWATCNVGATSPEQYGYYFAWGETSLKSTYTIDNSLAHGKSEPFLNNNGNLNLAYDAAAQNWGGGWRMPTSSEIKELADNTTSLWCSLGGIEGVLITSKINGQMNFIPAAGVKSQGKNSDIGNVGYFWSSTPINKPEVFVDNSLAETLVINQDRTFITSSFYARYFGLPIRAVIE